MPVRIGYPVGIRGITQLVQGPQYATGVGLVKFGAQAIADAREAGRATEKRAPMRSTGHAEDPEAAASKNGFWRWLKEAF
jgi:cell division protein FtsA